MLRSLAWTRQGIAHGARSASRWKSSPAGIGIADPAGTNTPRSIELGGRMSTSGRKPSTWPDSLTTSAGTATERRCSGGYDSPRLSGMRCSPLRTHGVRSAGPTCRPVMAGTSTTITPAARARAARAGIAFVRSCAPSATRVSESSETTPSPSGLRLTTSNA